MSENNSLYDVLIVGAGVFGMSTAYYLKQTDRSLNILVIDREGGAGEGNTCKSAAGFRNTFSSPENVTLTNTSIDKFVDIEKKDKFNLNLRMCGYLWLMGIDKYKKSLDAINAMKQNGVDFSVLFAEELRSVPGLNIDEYSSDECKMLGLSRIKCGLLGKKCGSLDPGAIVSYYESEFKKLGGQTKYNTKAESLILEPKEKLDIPGEPLVWQEPTIAGVRTDKGEIRAKTTLIAAGAWEKELLDPIGIDSHIKPKKRQLFQVKGSSLEPLIKCHGFSDTGTLPFTIIQKSGIYIKPEPRENCIYVGCADDIGRAYNLNVEPEREYYENSILPVLVEVFPQFKNAQLASMIAGSYAYNTIDKNPYIFRPLEDLIVVSGDSGSGIMKCDAVGRIASALYWKDEFAILYPNVPFRVSKLGVTTRDVTFERFVI